MEPKNEVPKDRLLAGSSQADQDVESESSGVMTVKERILLQTPTPAPPTAPNGSKLLAGLAQMDSPLPSTKHTEQLAQPRLVVVRGERQDATYPLLEGKNYIGRSADHPVDIDLDGQEPIERIWTSRQHAVITLDAYQTILEDLNSLNGTFVNRGRVHPGQKRVLQAGDVIQIGTVQLRYQV